MSSIRCGIVSICVLPLDTMARPGMHQISLYFYLSFVVLLCRQVAMVRDALEPLFPICCVIVPCVTAGYHGKGVDPITLFNLLSPICSVTASICVFLQDTMARGCVQRHIPI